MSKKKQKPNWPVEKFLPRYMQALAEGMDRQTFAEELGIKPLTVYARVKELQEIMNKHGRALPMLKPRKRKGLESRVLEVLEKEGVQDADIEAILNSVE